MKGRDHLGDLLRPVRELAERYPLSLHGVGMGLGAVEPLDAEHLRALTTLVRAVRPAAAPDVLCMAGRVVPIKDIETFVRAMRSVVNKLP